MAYRIRGALPLLTLLALPLGAQPFGGYVSFHGGPEYLKSGAITAGQPISGATFEAWVRITAPDPSGNGNCRSLFGKGWTQSFWVAYCGSADAPVLRSTVSGYDGFAHTTLDGGKIPIGTWTHVAVTSDGATRRHYINGVLAATRVGDAPPAGSTFPLEIGRDPVWQQGPYADLDELRIWTVARSQADLQKLMYTPLAGGMVGLLSSFPFEGNGNDVAGGASTTPVDGTVTFVGGPTSGRAFFVPVILRNQYSSEITFTNRAATPATVTLDYTATLGGGSGSGSFTLPAGRQRIEPDAMDFLRSLHIPVPTDGTLLGTLRVTFTGVSSTDAASVTVRTGTATASPVGRAGLAYAGVPVEKLFSSPVIVPGIRWASSWVRTNLALQNAGTPAEGNVTLRVTLFAQNGTDRPPLPDITLAPGEFHQYSSTDLGIPDGFVGSARVERVSPAGHFYAYAVQNDQTNSDGSFLPPVLPSSASGAPFVVPSIVESGSFRSEVFFVNLGENSHTARLTLDCPVCPGFTSMGILLGPHQVVYYPDIVGQLRASYPIPSPMGVGVITLSLPTGSDMDEVVAIVRTSSIVGDQGAYGVAYPSIRPIQGAADAGAWISAMQQNATNRSNLAFVNLANAGEGTISLHLEIWNGDTGALVASVDDARLAAIPARGFVQINGFLSELAPGVSNAYVRVTRTAGSNRFLAYGVVNDGGAPGQRTGDGAYVAMELP